jgi:hypothetical protein
VPKQDWFAFWVYVNTNRCMSQDFHRKVDHQFDYRLALLVITGLLRLA